MKLRTAVGLAGTARRPGVILVQVVALALAFAQLLAVPAAAQQISAGGPPPVRDNDDGPIRGGGGVGGVGGYPGRGLNLQFNASGRYESNLGRQEIPDAGYRLRPELQARYGIGLGQQGLYVEGTVARDMFFGATNLRDRDRYFAGAGLDYKLSRCSGQVGGSWQRALVFQSEAASFGGFQQDRTSLGVNANCRIGGALSVEGSVSRLNFSTENGASDAFNVNSWNYSLGLTLGSSTLGQFSLTGSLSDSQMPGRQVVTPNGLVDDSLTQRNVRVGYRRAFGSKINLSLGVSYIDSQPGTDEQVVLIDGVPRLVARDGFSGAGFDAALDLMLSPRLELQFTTSRSTFANPAVGAQFAIATNYAAVANYRLNERYTVSVGVTRRENRFRGGFASALDPVVRVADNLDRFYAQVSSRLGRRLRLSMDVSHNRRNSNPSVLNFSSTGVGLNLGLQFGRGR
jgi:Putative beta-barrel porin 2